ncbi:transglycosylase [Erwinia phage Machina]|uniref:Putative endolysin n=2 Tax=Machinavirus machina TaxID=2169990 RepID=A0A1B2IDD7_9CAUD|nr:transglycosylase [Erwinia phage vB_EamM_Huxley]YP_009617125.1 transglycosylase [Erwinia phage Machina]ANZ50118.1 putative endolysin [Erwinia phage vB_EamM_Parshik]QOC54660.1 putative endolysin [Salmonella phage pSal-SNUABM-04]ANZ49290.1 putative endolysin [Erwinia phage vB_EamM_Huxley]ANZ49846.1 putative endolysin [Erwinia phage Machina]
MLRFILICLATLLSFNAAAITSSPKKDYATEFKMIEGRFEKVRPLIVKISNEQGVHSGLMTTLIYKESTFNRMAVNKQGSTAKGLVGMTDPTKRAMLKMYGKQLGLARNADIHNSRVAIKLASAYLNHVENAMTKRLKRPVSNGEIYLGYKFGPAGAIAMLKKKPSKAARELRSYKRDAAFYGALVKPIDASEPVKQTAAVKPDDSEKVAELQEIWHTLYGTYAPVTRTTLLASTLTIGAPLEHRPTTMVSRFM